MLRYLYSVKLRAMFTQYVQLPQKAVDNYSTLPRRCKWEMLSFSTWYHVHAWHECYMLLHLRLKFRLSKLQTHVAIFYLFFPTYVKTSDGINISNFISQIPSASMQNILINLFWKQNIHLWHAFNSKYSILDTFVWYYIIYK